MRVPAFACPPMNAPIFSMSSIGGFSPASVWGSFLCMIMKRMVVSWWSSGGRLAVLGRDKDKRAQAGAAQRVGDPEDRTHHDREPDWLASVDERARRAAEVGGHQQCADELGSPEQM